MSQHALRPTVIIDPGHGGTSAYGGSSPTGVEPLEKQVNLELAQRVAARLGSAAQLTRTGDVNVPLRERAALAARSGARVLVSLHANAGAYGTRGSEVWVHERHDERSASLARELHGCLERVGPTRGLFQGPLAVLDPVDTGGAAACLIEADYLSDPQGRQRLTDPRELDRLADAISTGVNNYLGRGHGNNYSDSYAYGRVGPRDPDAYGSHGSLARSLSIIEPNVDYSATNMSESNRIWADWLDRYGRWRKGVPDAALTRFPHAAICQLRLTVSGSNGRTGTGYGTGFYIGNEKLLTVGHNFRLRRNGVTWTATRVEVQPGYSPRVSTLPTRSYAISNHHDLVHPRWSSASGDRYEPGWDLAVLRVPGLPASAGVFSLTNQSLAADEGIVVCGYGKVAGEDSASQPQRMDGARISRADHDTMDYPVQTEGGHSGSPVFYQGTVVGVHRSGADDYNNAAVVLTPEKIDWINSR